jgi:hypothetical protein
MTRRLPLFLFAALVAVTLLATTLLATTPLAAQTPEPQEPPEETMPAEPVTEGPDDAEVGERMERSEEGTLEGSIVLLDADNLIVETADGDRAFSIRETSELPTELREAAAWASYRGVPVRVAFAPGDEGELRVVRTLTLMGDGTATTTTTADTSDTGATAARTDLGDESDVVEPTDPAAATSELTATTVRPDEEAMATTTTTTTTDGSTTGRLIADANDDDMDAAAGFAAADDEVPPGERMASLPATASSLPWIALIGTLALLAALGLGRLESLRRRAAVDGSHR